MSNVDTSMTDRKPTPGADDAERVAVTRRELAAIESARKQLYQMLAKQCEDTWFLVRLNRITEPLWDVANLQRPALEASPAIDEERNMWCALIDYVIEADEPETFLRAWREGDFDALREEWPNVPEAIFPRDQRKPVPERVRHVGA